MGRSRRRRAGRRVELVAVIALAVAALVLAALSLRPDPTPPPSDISPAAARTTTSPTPRVAPLHLPSHPKVVAIGDSWSTGYAAPADQGFLAITARTLGWQVRLLPYGSGTGYVARGPNVGDFAERLAAEKRDPSVDLVFIQGSVNDADPKYRANVIDNAVKTYKLARERFPNARVLAMGPIEQRPGRVDITEVDHELGIATEEAGVLYVSPTDEAWWTGADLSRYILPSAQYHPNGAGHALLARRLIADIRKLSR